MVGAIVVVLVLGAGGVVFLSQDRQPALATAEVARYLAAWEGFDASAMSALVDGTPPGLAEAVAAMRDDLRVTSATFRTLTVERSADDNHDEQLATYHADLELARIGHLAYDGHLRLVRTPDEEWRIAWDHAALHPDLRPDHRFQLDIAWSTRAPIVGVGGSTLVSTADMVLVGLQPGRIQDLAQVQAILNQQLGTDPPSVAAALAAPGVGADDFVSVAQVPRDRFAALRPVLEPVPGIFFRQDSGRITPTPDFAAHLLGRVGEVTAERLTELGPPYLEGDQVGLSGLEAAHERQLAGVPSAEARIVDGAGVVAAVLVQLPGTAPVALVLTLDRRVQEAADQALAGVDHPAAIVAIDAPTGEVRAVAARPLDQAFNRAVHGAYAPGSSFKVVTSEGLVHDGGVGPDTVVACEPSATIGGKPFKNFEDEAFGPIPFRDAFAHSCNTAFVTLADEMSDENLMAAAGRFGFDVPYDAGVDAVGGQFPDPNDAADRAASAIGQGRVLASPLHMASVAAAVSAGTWRPPRIVDSDPAGVPIPLDPATVAVLGDLMREVVRTGTGTAAAVPDQDVAGKTGTAEFGNADPPETHAWFIGFRGSLGLRRAGRGRRRRGTGGGADRSPLPDGRAAGVGPPANSNR